MHQGKIESALGQTSLAFNLIEKSDSIEGAIETLQHIFQVQHVTFHLANVNFGPIDSPFVRSTYPPEWIARYLLKGYVDVDPVVATGFSGMLPFFWSELEIDERSMSMMADAQAFGLGADGYSIPVIDKSARRSLLSFSADAPTGTWKHYIRNVAADLAEMAHILHKKALMEAGCRFSVHLGPREIECLYWLAQGKDAGTIADILIISEHTVRSYLKSIRHKLSCSSLPQAVAKAITMRLITL
ncbi:helix-turn-helix transcriptional regulator [Nitratireductor soli]|uniref:helix-turn-helix transcriptional regulator n=1 Tax=Nitratireductor soli TaxID=1670619 RepID=UPI00065E8862|nr:LuxR family transcriptional regulator [Nitratireductor soli]